MLSGLGKADDPGQALDLTSKTGSQEPQPVGLHRGIQLDDVLAPTLALPLTCAGERWPQEDQGFLGAAQVRAGRADGGRQGASAHAAEDLHRALRQLSPCRRP